MLWPLLFCALVALTSGFRSVCYYTNWAQYRHGKGLFYPENMDPTLCTHLIYAFAKPVGLDIQAFEWNDESTEWSEGMYSRVMKLRAKNPNMKILLAVGGYNMGSEPFIPIVDTVSTRVTFAQNAVKFLRQRDFDGLDMDWEYPGARGSPPTDKAKLVLLMQELRRTFEIDAQNTGKPRLLLTGALPAGKENIDGGFDIVNVMQPMDFVSIMTYDLHGSWEPYTGINSPLFANPKDVGNSSYLNLHWAAQYYLSLGAPKDKINIGIALYGRTFLLDNPNEHDIGSHASLPGDAGLFTGEQGFLAYYEVCDLINSGASVVDVTSQRNRYAYKGRTWVGYDDVQSVTEKACYTKENGFGGVMFWAPDLDDFSGQTCSQGTYPLINAVRTEMSNPSLANCVTPPPLTGVTFPTQSPNSPSPVTPAITISLEYDCTGKADDFYPDPNSCDHFFICTQEVAYKAHCGQGLLFNTVTNHCENDFLATCNGAANTANPNPSTQTTQAAPQTTPSTVCVGLDSVTLPHPTNCHKFILCIDEAPMELDCQGSMVFNPELGKCDFSSCNAYTALG